MKNKFLKGLVASLALAVSGLANAELITFDSLEVNNSLLNTIPSGVYEEGGFTLSFGAMHYAGQQHVNQYAGSAGLHMRSSNGLITLFDSNNDLFSIESIGLSVLRNGRVSPSITFIGSLFGGGTVQTTFTPVTFGFTDFVFDSSFSSLTSLTWRQGSGESNAHQFDNIKLNSVDVPEPSTLAVFVLGLMGLASRKFKKQA
ncbi:PEP-CTERM sorting domain-containing protein [Catenovulum sediminis]|uniref:PEP-CTERM sorting domain-containing protein n=1 Tax=Catenovulum sediminis TaxID=1740262 RepID=A0ABV1RF13_9ALTE